ncbi:MULTISPECIES: NAD(P)H-hydrate dehydratase [unclassified Exiguobacterium]|uniref:NAD(P)H-hydrate dehydratase n=1 Tax=unclassified Exiguobacterium TaxID=2644629 RepID=UPI001BE8338F|nr:MULTISPECIES: NAD(P)H-hydrate dehydratase [unclassified Exiguobacterium]
MIYTAAEIKQIDQTATQNGMPESVLMERAASAIVPKLPIESHSTILVVCGTGNNGGDGWVVARELAVKGHEVSVWLPLGDSKSEAASTHAAYASSLVRVIDQPIATDIVIDALFGVGLSGPVTGKARDVIEWVNQQMATVLSIDLPSGIPSDHAREFDGLAIQATRTYCLHGYKRTAFLNRTSTYYGQIERIDIGLPHTSDWRVLTESDFNRSLLERDRFSHKTDYGHGILIGGSRHLLGAPFLGGRAAIRSGIGLLNLSIPREASPFISTLPEAMYNQHSDVLEQSYDAIAIGPGMVEGEWMDTIWQQVKHQSCPIIVDAGALSTRRLETRGPLILTPHPGEFSRLTNQSVEEIEGDRFAVASEFAKQHRVHLILKGTYTLIVTPDGKGAVNTVEASALAKGGSGDILTGILLALWSRKGELQSPSEQAVLWHALAAKSISRTIHPASVLASDVIEELGRI